MQIVCEKICVHQIRPLRQDKRRRIISIISAYLQGRNSSKPIAICVSEIEEIYTWASVTVSRNVLEELLPGQVQLQ